VVERADCAGDVRRVLDFRAAGAILICIMRIRILFFASVMVMFAGDGRTPVLVELFTSEGCSSCPPADRLLVTLDQKQPVKGVDIIVLSEHVDYWDGDGWRDPFGSREFTLRQRDYLAPLKGDDVFTPQMVVDGTSGFVGNDGEAALKAINKEAGRAVAAIQIEHVIADGASLSASLSIQEIPADAGKGPFDVIVAVTESGLNSRPNMGENKGVALSHAGVVRSLTRVGKATGTGFQGEFHIKMDKSWKRESVKVVAFLQDRKTRRVWGAAQAALPQ
jgi:hypothetical protein